MNNLLSNMNLGEIIKRGLEGPHSPLVIAIMGILTAFGIYMRFTAGEDLIEQETKEEFQ